MGYPNTPPVFTDYPASIGAKRFALLPNGHAGPNPYVAVVLPSTGDSIDASEFGFKWVDRVFGGLSSDGLYWVEPVNPTAAPIMTGTKILLSWTVLATGVPVAPGVDLSASVVSLAAVGW